MTILSKTQNYLLEKKRSTSQLPEKSSQFEFLSTSNYTDYTDYTGYTRHTSYDGYKANQTPRNRDTKHEQNKKDNSFVNRDNNVRGEDLASITRDHNLDNQNVSTHQNIKNQEHCLKRYNRPFLITLV